MKRKISVTPSALVSEIATLLEATPANLKKRWRALYGTEPPRRIRRGGLAPADLLFEKTTEGLSSRITGFLLPRNSKSRLGANYSKRATRTERPSTRCWLARLHPDQTVVSR